METQILMYIFIGVFAITALLTLAGIAGWLKMEEKYLKPLYRLLILEVVGFILAFMWQSYIRRDGMIDHARVANKAGLLGSVPAELDALENWLEGHFERSAEYEQINSQVNDLRSRYELLQSECERDNGCPDAFYQNIESLIAFLSQYYGFINLDFEEKEKDEVYIVLARLLNNLRIIERDDMFSNRAETKPDYKRIKKAYLEFREGKRGKPIPEKEQYLILPSDIGFFMQEYADRRRRR